MRKLGIMMHAVKGMSDEEYIREIASVGFSATFTTPREPERQYALAELCAKYNVSCDTLHADCRRIFEIWNDASEGEAVVDRICLCIDRCALVGIPIAVMHLEGGGVTACASDIGISRISRIIEYACAKNVKVAFENQVAVDKLALVLGSFDDTVCGYCYDSGHALNSPHRDNFLPMFGSRLIAIHLHDNLGHIIEGNYDYHMIPFDGIADFDKIASQLRESGFDGTLMLELKYNGSVGNAHCYDELTPSDYLKRAADAAGRLRTMIDF